jgi:predicted Fe-Mo cluster-binding NifX family protein
MRKWLKFVVISLCLSHVAVATELPVASYIMSDLAHEIQESDFLNISAEAQKALSEKIKTQSLTYSELVQLLSESLGSDFNFLKSLKKMNYTGNDHKKSIALISTEISQTQTHSIEDLPGYVKNRIGEGTFQVLSQEGIPAYVIGGDQEKIVQYCQMITGRGTHTITPIPSLYSQWGLFKYEVSSVINPAQKSIVWIVPPSTQYVRHYAQLFSFAQNKPSRFYIDPKSQENYRNTMKQNADAVFSKLSRPHYLVFGYSYLWKERIQKGNDWDIVSESSVKDLQLGLNYTHYSLRSKTNPGTKQIHVGVLSSNQTVWGELASFKIEAFLHKNLNGVFFLGSAGSTSADINPYSISAPEKFLIAGQRISVTNLIGPDAGLSSTVDLHLDSRHGNTYSPIQQTKSYLQTLQSKGIGTVDVEQSLIAAAVKNYNSVYNASIQYGAINVITDKPVGILNKETGLHSLDHRDPELKSKARKAAVDLALFSLTKNEVINSCKKLFL